MSKPELPPNLNLAPFVGRWIAVVRGQIIGVGRTAEEARQLAMHNRPKETPSLTFVSAEQQIARQIAQLAPLTQIFDLAQAQQVEIYLVGGSVRDLLLGRPTHDLDFAVSGDGLSIARQIANALHAAYVPLDPERKTGRIILQEAGLYVDIATMRGPDLLADLHGRDFTINAMALTRTAEGVWQLIDPLGGQTDMQQGILRAASDTSLEQDPLRTLRAVRMCAQFGCTLHPDTERAVHAAAARLAHISAERLRDEWFKILTLPGAAQSIRRLDQLGLLGTLLPELAADGPSRPALDHATATVEALERLWFSLTHPDQPANALTPLLPFVADLTARYESRICDERTHLALLKCAALLHESAADPAQSAQIAATLARRWRCSNREINMLHTTIIGQAQVPTLVAQATWSRRDIYRFYRIGGEYGVDAALIALACWHARQPTASHQPAQRQRWITVVAKLTEAYYLHRQTVIDPPLLLNGRDLLALGIEPGPQIGALLANLHEEQAAGTINNCEQALAYVAQHSSQKGKL